MDANFEMRRIRNILLKASDWTQLPDSPLTDSKKLNGQPIAKHCEIYHLRERLR